MTDLRRGMPASLDDVCAQDPKPKPPCLRGKKRGPKRGSSGGRCVREKPEGRSQTQRPPSRGAKQKTAECFCRCEAKLSLSASLPGKGEKGKREWEGGQAAARWRTRDGRSGGRGQNVTWNLSLPDSGRLKSKLRFASRPSKPSAGIRGHQGRVVGGQ